jgi:hypothetical protein
VAGPSGAGAALPLRQNAPNPFPTATRIRFLLPQEDEVTLEVHDPAGRKVATLLNHERRAAGRHDIEFRAEGIPSGLYCYRLVTSRGVDTRKMLILK